MTIDHDSFARRTVLSAALGASFAIAAGPAAAGVLPSTEAANLTLAADFCASWAKGKVDVEQMVATYFHPDCIVRVMDSAMTAHGHGGTKAMLYGWLEGKRRFDLKVIDSRALGPLVIQTREDVTYSPGAAPHVDKIACVFVIADGKIKEWSDYFR